MPTLWLFSASNCIPIIPPNLCHVVIALSAENLRAGALVPSCPQTRGLCPKTSVFREECPFEEVNNEAKIREHALYPETIQYYVGAKERATRHRVSL